MTRPDTSDAVVVLVRHGSTAWTRESRFTGHADVPLDADGRRQAARVAQRVIEVRPQLVVASDLRRASSTAEYISRATATPLVLDRRLREEHLGGWEGLTRDEVSTRFPDEFARWAAGELRASANREGLTALRARAAAALCEVLTTASHCVVVSHSNVVIALTQTLLGLPRDERVHISSAAPGGCRVIRSDDAGHWAIEDDE